MANATERFLHIVLANKYLMPWTWWLQCLLLCVFSNFFTCKKYYKHICLCYRFITFKWFSSWFIWKRFLIIAIKYYACRQTAILQQYKMYRSPWKYPVHCRFLFLCSRHPSSEKMLYSYWRLVSTCACLCLCSAHAPLVRSVLLPKAITVFLPLS